MNAAQEALITRIADQLEAGVAPWVRPWAISGISTMPHNFSTGRNYHGLNIMQLWGQEMSFGYPSAAWCTFVQARELGGSVRKGEKGTPVWFMATREWETADEETGDKERVKGLVCKQFFVFNRAQCDGLPIPAEVETKPFDPIANVESYVCASGADVRHGGDEAYYLRAGDYIQMPEPGRFVDAAAYYGALLHEMTHWTGAPHRLDREKGKRFGDRAYAVEELTAELGAAFACAQLGLPSAVRHTEYLATWASALRDEPRALWAAASQASRAVAFLDEKAGYAQATEAVAA
jgi:antirestriction protein ArdC